MTRPALSAARAVDVLNFLAARPTEAFTLSDLVERLGINVASLHAVLAALTGRGYVERHPRHRTYRLGPALVAVGAVALEQHPAIEAAREEARLLSDRLRLDVAVTVRAGGDLAFVARTGTRHPHGELSYVGQRIELRPPMGSILYAWSDRDSIERWLARAPEDERARDREVLAAVAARGYSVTVQAPPGEHARPTEHLVDIDPEATYAVSAISGPVFDANGAVAIAINFVGFPTRLSGTEVLDLGIEVRNAGLLVTKQTRGTIPATLLTASEADVAPASAASPTTR